MALLSLFLAMSQEKSQVSLLPHGVDNLPGHQTLLLRCTLSVLSLMFLLCNSICTSSHPPPCFASED